MGRRIPSKFHVQIAVLTLQDVVLKAAQLGLLYKVLNI